MTTPSVSIVIPVLNGGRLFAESMAALKDQTKAVLEIVVVDSGSSDGSVSVARAHGAKIVEIEQRDFDHGASRNLGIAQTRGDLVVLLTQDATPASPGFLDAISAPFADPAVAGVLGRQIPRDDCDVVTRRNLRHWLTGRDRPDLSRIDEGEWERLPPIERYQRCVFDSVCCALRRTRWLELPYERASFGEDIIWGRAAVRRGWSIAYAPDAAVLHSHRRSILYEYRRARESHALLHGLFDLATLPRMRDVPRAWLANLKQDLPYTWTHAPGGIERLRQLARAAGLALAGPVAQHLGIRDAKRAGRRKPSATDGERR